LDICQKLTRSGWSPGSSANPVKSTKRRGLKQVDFGLGERNLRALEQNPDTKSRWAAMARDGKKVMQFVEDGRYIDVLVDGKVHVYGSSSKPKSGGSRKVEI
jgi:hypothetical protein